MMRSRRFQAGVACGLAAASLAVLFIAALQWWRYSSQFLSRRTAARAVELEKLGDQGWEVAWDPRCSEFAVLEWRGPARRFSHRTLVEFEGGALGDEATHFAFSPVPGVAAINRGSVVTILRDREPTGVAIEAGGGQPGLAFSPDGAVLATSCYGTMVRLWRVADGSLVRTLQVTGAEGGLTTAFSPDGRIIAVGNRNGDTSLFDAATGGLLRVLGRGMSHELAFSPRGDLLAVSYTDGKIGIWSPASGELLRLLDGRGEEVFSLAWSPSGDLLASGGLKAPILLWDAKKFTIVQSLPAPERVFSLAFSPDARYLLSAGNQAVQLWGVPSR